jgi:hypothetical protein
VRRSLLRAALIGISGILLAAAAWLAITGCTPARVSGVAVAGFVLVFGLLVERWRYKPLMSRQPAPDWLATDERFVDPETGKLVTVFYKPSTGERRYVSV